MLRESLDSGAVRGTRTDHGDSVRIVLRRRKKQSSSRRPFVIDGREVSLSPEAPAPTGKSPAWPSRRSWTATKRVRERRGVREEQRKAYGSIAAFVKDDKNRAGAFQPSSKTKEDARVRSRGSCRTTERISKPLRGSRRTKERGDSRPRGSRRTKERIDSRSRGSRGTKERGD